MRPGMTGVSQSSDMKQTLGVIEKYLLQKKDVMVIPREFGGKLSIEHDSLEYEVYVEFDKEATYRDVKEKLLAQRAVLNDVELLAREMQSETQFRFRADICDRLFEKVGKLRGML